LAHVLALSPDAPNVLQGELQKKKLVALSEPIELDDIKRLGKHLGCTINDLAAVGAIPAELEKRVVTMFSSRATTVLTNVPGPREPLKLAGSEISSLMFWVPQSGGLGLGLSILSYNNAVRVGVAADAGLVKYPEALARDFEEAFEELLRVESAVPELA